VPKAAKSKIAWNRLMRKLRKPIIKELPPVKLYLDDLKSIHDLLQEKVKSIDITTEAYEVEDIKQLKDLEVKEIHYLSIKCSNPYMSIEFRPSSASVYFAEDSTYNRGILSEIEDILNKRKSFLRSFLTSSWAELVLGGFVGFSFVAMLVMLKNESLAYFWLFLGLVLLSIFFSVHSFRLGLWNYCTIALSKRKEENSFWKRNRDQILVATIAAIAGSLVTIFALWMFELL